MIFVTVGTQLPFDRLVSAVDTWAGRCGRDDVFAQVGPTELEPRHIRWSRFVDAPRFHDCVEQSCLVVAHAGMGSILTALELGKRIIVMPRRAGLGEHRNDHQLSTARRLQDRGITVAFNESELVNLLRNFRELVPPTQISLRASDDLVKAVRDFVLSPSSDPSHESLPITVSGSSSTAGDATLAVERLPPMPRPADRNGQPERQSDRSVHALLLLAGGRGLRDVAALADRSILDLPIAAGETLFSRWHSEAAAAVAMPHSRIPKLVVVGGLPLWSVSAADDEKLRVEHVDDPHELRGTGGILQDLAARYDDGYLLVAAASTVLLEPLGAVVEELWNTSADVALFMQGDGSSPNLMLVRTQCLRSIPPVGFVDFKEQALPRIAAGHSVTVIRRDRPIAAAARTPAEYIRALRQYHELRNSSSPLADGGRGLLRPFAETWQAAFSIIEDNAEVEAGANIADSVILSGARVGRGADVVRSVVCPGAVVPPFATVVDEVVRPQNAKAIARAIGAGR